MKINKNTANAYAVMKNTEKNTLHIVQELHTFLSSFNGIVFSKIVFKVSLSCILFPSIFSLHSSSNLPIILFLHLQLL